MFRFIILVILSSGVIGQNDFNVRRHQSRKFPPGFLFGAGSSSVQVEGAWNEDGKGISDWDVYQHIPGIVGDNSTSDIACDSYHLYKNDIPYLKMAGMNAYRFSLSWPRLLPYGSANIVNQKGVEYYNNLINDLLSYNMTPVVTIFHHDLPLNYSKLGGFANEYVANAFVDYAEFVLKTFGDRIKTPTKTGAVMGLSVGYQTYYPWNSFNIFDYESANVASEFLHGWILNPVFGTGGYPPVMRKRVDFKSFKEGLKKSRLPRFTPAQIALIKRSADFVSLNQYTGLFASFIDHCSDLPIRILTADSGAYGCRKPGYVTTYGNFMQIIPGSLKKALANIRNQYNNPPVLITENGYPDGPGENLTYNPQRQTFFEGAIGEALDSITDGSKLMGYLTWSLLDDFEWNSGYTIKFGAVHVNFTDPNRKRTAKPIVNFFKDFAEYGLNATNT